MSNAHKHKNFYFKLNLIKIQITSTSLLIILLAFDFVEINSIKNIRKNKISKYSACSLKLKLKFV